MRGFTLVELIVSIGIFSVVMVVALGSLLSISAGERKAETIKSVMNNLNFSIESMSRTIRTSYNYGCSTAGSNCTSGGPSLIFTSSESGNPVYTYCLSNGAALSCSPTANCPLGAVCSILRSVSTINSGEFIPLTAPEVEVSNLTFYVVGAPEGLADNIQPKVTIAVAGLVKVNETQNSSFNLQTTVTQRLYDQ
jgi:prepilin-type N-terminal cleavage/methylation domain-containing protein